VCTDILLNSKIITSSLKDGARSDHSALKASIASDAALREKFNAFDPKFDRFVYFKHSIAC